MRLGKLLPKPDFKGHTDGQCRTIPWRVSTGGRFPWYPPGRDEPIWLEVKESRVMICWIWDKRKQEWVDGDTWAERRNGPNSGRVMVSKHDDLHRRLADRHRRSMLIEKRRRELK